MHPNGIRAEFSRKNLMWIVTNNKGIRRATKDGVSWDMESIPSALETDAVTYAQMMVREDKVISVTFYDGTYYVEFKDGTNIRTSADKREIRIEK